MSDLERHSVPPAIEAADWDLRVTGAVERPLRLDESDLDSLPREARTDDFECAEGWVAEGLSWRGVPVAALLDRATPTAGSEYALVRSMDGDYACSFGLNALSNAVLAVELDGDPLPVEHGGPARLVPGSDDADCWESVKWVSEIELATAEPTAADTAEEIARSRFGGG